jgi:HNH endonuclease
MFEGERVRYWEVGAAVMRDLRGPYEYGCPLCLRLFPRDQIEHLSLDHVPPKSVGGKLEVLTCKSCNETAGAELDSHAFAVERIRRVLAGERYPPVLARFKFGRVTANMELRSDGALNEILGLPASNPPGVLDEVMAIFDAHVRAGTSPSIKFAMPTLRPSLRRAAVSYLRAGYLAAFAAIGYAAIARQSFDPVRQQICEPDVEHLPHFFYCHRDLHGYWVAVVEEPRWASSIVVLMGNYQITLPLFDDAGLYERLAEKAAAGARAELRCQRLGWPRWPVYHGDHHWARSGGFVRLKQR